MASLCWYGGSCRGRGSGRGGSWVVRGEQGREGGRGEDR